jgi:spermidine synthase
MLFRWLLLLFAGSGCAALIYEVVWFQLLQLVIGSSAISLGLVLATYMGGLCVGSIVLPRIEAVKRYHPLKFYALLEFGIGLSGLLVLAAVPFMAQLYVAGALPGGLSILLRGLVASVCLLPPTILMGATLPAIARWLHSGQHGMVRLGFLYAANIVGAVFGCILAGFYLLRVSDVYVATVCAFSLNVIIAFIAWMLAKRSVHIAASTDVVRRLDKRADGFGAVYLAIAVSGICALGAQVVWTRLLALMLGVTTYTFSIILAVFLVGLAVGAYAGSFIARRTTRPRTALAAAQVLLAAAVALAAQMLSNVIPYWPIDPWLSLEPWFTFQVDVLRTVAAIFPATLLWGASFPLALAAVATPGQDPGRLSGETYAANTMGAIVGAFAFSIIVIPRMGTLAAQQLLIALSMSAALLMLVHWHPFRIARTAVVSIALAGFAAVLVSTVSEIPWRLLAYGHRIAPTLRAVELYPASATHLLYRGEGISSSIVIAESDGGQRSYHVSGKTEATTALEDMRLQRMLGHIPALLHPNPKSVLSWGFGAGVTAGSFVVHPGIERMTICELEPLVPAASTKYFGEANYNVMNDPRTTIVFDDARHFLLTSREKYDIITSDPLDPWAKGTAALYTREFFQVIKDHLNPGGMFAQFVQLYETNTETVKSELATFAEVFPDVTVWSNNVNGEGYDLVLLGRTATTPIDVDAMQERLERGDHARAARSIADIGFNSAVELLGAYMGRPLDLAPWLKDAEINRDRNLRLQYLGGLGVNSGSHELIHRELLKYRRYPEGLFTGDPPRIRILTALLSPR